MPRRPRPATRRRPQQGESPEKFKPAASASRAKSAATERRSQPQKENSEVDSSVSESGSEDSFEEDENLDEDLSRSEAEEGELDMDDEPDTARVAQWVDEEELDDLSEEEDSTGDESADKSRLQADLQSLSFGALRKAKNALAKAQVMSGSEDEDASDESEPEEQPAASIYRSEKGKEREVPVRDKKEIPKRKHKHAPLEMSSRRPVPRARLVGEEKPAPRDPRFLSVTGEYDPKRFQTQYGFLSTMHVDELKTLRENLKRARKLLANSPRDLRPERETEVERLERAVKRAESAVNKDRREKVEMDALSKAAKEEREKQNQGKKAWYMKDADKKALLLRAKYDALAAAGGKGAVRKAIEKKQKKVNQKEKKKRPFAAGQAPRNGPLGGEGGPSRKRSQSAAEGGSRKRPRNT
ncbi:DUF947-domain-containing protein [Lentinus tigrinus ALCF2SS1-7]|uniref:DUF947-domain-containing protein n=1 Tax=Lentinus tigrinus ALCF2SS1-7 TaxID=1328758 RepID=UPI00116626C4|nr:DUF947-domain-containing protein [Lentinus tigrinus ALCF2SS1-7]